MPQGRVRLSAVQRRAVGVGVGDVVWYNSPTTGTRRQARVESSPLPVQSDAFRRFNDEGLVICDFPTGRTIETNGHTYRIAALEGLRLSVEFEPTPPERFEVGERRDFASIPLPRNWYRGEDSEDPTWHTSH